MHVAYLTSDEINLSRAAQTASECGASLAPLPPEGVMPSGPFAVVLFDLDHHDANRGQEVDDPATLCARVRSLASRCYQVVVGAGGFSVASPQDVGELLEQVAHLEQQVDRLRRIHKLPLEDLRNWMSSLRRRIESSQP
jgi:hypothetical protein